MAALTATAMALVPIATWASATPTTYTISGTARIDPPPPTKPSENPTSAPDASPSPACIAEIIKKSPPYRNRPLTGPEWKLPQQEGNSQWHQKRRHERVESPLQPA